MTDFQQYFDESHQLIRDSVRRFVEREVLPHIDEWEEAEEFPRELYLKAGAAGILGIGYPEAYGGSCEGDLFAKVAASEGSCAAVPAAWSPGWDRWISACLRWSSGPVRGARAGGAGGAARREDHGPGGHRALWRLRRGQPEDPCGARWRSLSRQRQQDLHHQRRARGLLHGGGAYRRRGFRRHQPAAGGEGHCRVQCRPQAEEDGLVGVGYRRTVLRRLPGACGKPDRRGECRLRLHHGQFPERAPGPGGDGQHDRATGSGGVAALGARAKRSASRSASSRCCAIVSRKWPRNWRFPASSPIARQRRWLSARA